MPKLITKQDGVTAAAARKNSTATWLSVGGLLALLAVVAVAAFFFTRTPLPGSELEPLTFSSATNEGATTSYESLYVILGDLMIEYEGLAERGVDDYQKNLMLLGKSESILAHLDKMDATSDQLGLDDKEYSELGDRHQFYKDFWQAKLHFRQLRISRFEKTPADAITANEQLSTTATAIENSDAQELGETVQLNSDVAEPKKKKFQFAKPPAGMALPAGFCDLSAPDSSCKPDADMAGMGIVNDMLPEQELPLEDGNLMAETTEELALIDETLATDEPPKKRKFQFAKPPEGMALPAGFCDLTNPDASCKPESEPATVLDAEAMLFSEQEPVALNDDIAVASEEPTKKRKFQFAKPPKDMELPAGFCDLTNPGSCKPESN